MMGLRSERRMPKEQQDRERVRSAIAQDRSEYDLSTLMSFMNSQHQTQADFQRCMTAAAEHAAEDEAKLRAEEETARAQWQEAKVGHQL